jgi:hypothetical protein
MAAAAGKKPGYIIISAFGKIYRPEGILAVGVRVPLRRRRTYRSNPISG